MRTSSDFAEDVVGEVVKGWAEIAAVLGCSVRTAQRWAKAGLIPVYKSARPKPSRVHARRAEVGAWKERSRCMVRGAGFAQQALTDAVKNHKYIRGWKAIACLLNLSVSTVQL